MYPAIARAAKPRGLLSRCCCGRSFKPEKDMETYCSSQCAREDTLRALLGEENVYRQKVQARQLQPPKTAGRRYVEKLVPRMFASPDRHLPPTPLMAQTPPPLPPKTSSPRGLTSTKENHSQPSAPRPNISSPFALQPRNAAYPLGAGNTSRLHLPALGCSPYAGPRPVGSTPSKPLPKPRGTPARNDSKAIRRSASESRLKNAVIRVGYSNATELKDLPLTYYLQPTRGAEIRPAVFAPIQPRGQPFAGSPYLQVPSERQLRRSRSFSPHKPFFPENVPEDVNQDGLSFRISGDVWWVVTDLRKAEDIDIHFFHRRHYAGTGVRCL